MCSVVSLVRGHVARGEGWLGLRYITGGVLDAAQSQVDNAKQHLEEKDFAFLATWKPAREDDRLRVWVGRFHDHSILVQMVLKPFLVFAVLVHPEERHEDAMDERANEKDDLCGL